jgi:hypothetical protein
MLPRTIRYHGMRYHLHTGLFGLGAPAVQPDWTVAYQSAAELQKQAYKLYRAAQELQRQITQQTPMAKRLGLRVQTQLAQLVEQLKQVLQHTPV